MVGGRMFKAHGIPVVIAAVLPCLAFEGYGQAFLPFLYIFSVPFHQFIFSRFWAFPLLALLIFTLEKTDLVKGDTSFLISSSPFLGDAVTAVVPIAISIFVHFVVVYFAKLGRKKFARDIDEVCSSVSDYLVVRCYEKRSLPSFLYMKSERVLIAVSCTLKIILAVTYLVLFFAFNEFPDGLGCSVKRSSTSHLWLWAMFVFVFVTEVLYHAALFLSGIIRAGVNESFAHIVLIPTYWQWYRSFLMPYALVISILFSPNTTV
jgi:hypothetical protein